MSKFSKGDKARVISVDSYDAKEGVKVGDIVTVNHSDSCSPWVILGDGRIYCLTQSKMEHYTETPKEITLNGATYVLKEEPNPEHKWKFGDWGRHKYGTVGMCIDNVSLNKDLWWFAIKGATIAYKASDVTFIKSADIPE